MRQLALNSTPFFTVAWLERRDCIFFFFLIGPRAQTFREASRTGLGQCWRYFWSARRGFWPPEGGLLGTALVSSEEELKYAEYCSPHTSPLPSNSSELQGRMDCRCSCFLPGLVGWRAKGS